MKRFFIIIMVVVILLITAISYIYLGSNAIIFKKYNIPLVDIVIPKDSLSQVLGKRIALTRGCYGCHNDNLRGEPYFGWESDTGAEPTVAANISKIIPQYSDKELFRLVKHGIKKDGTGLWGMPVGMFVNLTSEDIGRLITHLRTVPAVENNLPKTSFTFKGRMKIMSGEVIPEVERSNQKIIKQFHYPDNPTVVQKGQYLAVTTCTECHGYDLRGAYGNPPLIIAKAYKEEEFVRFLKTGEAPGGRDLKFMASVARSRLTNYTEEEIKAIYAFLIQMEK